MSRRILHVAQPVEAGVPIVVRNLVRHQIERGCVVAVACPPQGSLPRWAGQAGAEVLPWAATRSPGRSVLAECRTLRSHVRRFAPDVVHLHSSKAGLVGRLVVRGRRPTVYQPHAWSFFAVHGVVRKLAIRWERLGARWADVLLCISADEVRSGQQAGLHGRWSVCENGVDLDRFAPVSVAERDAVRARLGLTNGTVVVCVGRLCEQKGQDLLVAAWRRLAPTDAVLVLVGDGPDRRTLEQSAGPGVVFAGDVVDTTPWYHAADLAVAPSRWEGGASLVTREAMACGISQVVSDVDGARDALGDAGAVVPVNDVAALTEAIQARLADASLRAVEGLRARAIASQRFDLTAALRKVDGVYDEILINS